MTVTSERLVEGQGPLRCWSVSKTGSVLTIELWSSVRQKVMLAIACLLAGAPVPLLLREVVLHPTERGPWMASLIYGGVVFVAYLAAATAVRRETIRQSRRHVEITGFLEGARLEVGERTEIHAFPGLWAEMTASISVSAPGRLVQFGRWLPSEASSEIARLMREHRAVTRAADPGPDGVARRVPRQSGVGAKSGAEDLIVEDGWRPIVTGGVLRWGAASVPWGTAASVIMIVVVTSGVMDDVSRLPWMVGPFVALAVIFCSGGIIDQLHVARSRRAVAAASAEPWRAVAAFNDGVVAIPIWRRCIPSALGVAVAVGMGAVVFFEHSGTPDVGGLVGWVFAGAIGVFCAYRLQNVVFQGVTEVRVTETPLRSRGPVTISFAVGRRGAHFEDIHFRLLRMVEVSRGLEGRIVGYSHSATYILPDDQPPPGPGEQVEAHFVLPTDASGTDLVRMRPVYWMLEVSGTTSSGWYSERFPVPIYDVD